MNGPKYTESRQRAMACQRLIWEYRVTLPASKYEAYIKSIH